MTRHSLLVAGALAATSLAPFTQAQCSSTPVPVYDGPADSVPPAPPGVRPASRSGSAGKSAVASPSSPVPLNPSTGRSGPRRGSPLIYTRRPTAEKKLKIDWQYPVPAVVDAEHTGSVPDALAQVRAGDPRPLLVVRECSQCKGTDNALLGAGPDDERIQTMARFFRCAKLPDHVLDAKHAFHSLFARPDLKDTPHVFLLSADEQLRIDFAVPYSQGDLHKGMTKILAHDYDGDTDVAVKELISLLDEFDQIDDREKQFKADLDRALETEKPGSAKIVKLTRRLEELMARRKVLLASEKQLVDLALK